MRKNDEPVASRAISFYGRLACDAGGTGWSAARLAAQGVRVGETARTSHFQPVPAGSYRTPEPLASGVPPAARMNRLPTGERRAGQSARGGVQSHSQASQGDRRGSTPPVCLWCGAAHIEVRARESGQTFRCRECRYPWDAAS